MLGLSIRPQLIRVISRFIIADCRGACSLLPNCLRMRSGFQTQGLARSPRACWWACGEEVVFALAARAGYPEAKRPPVPRDCARSFRAKSGYEMSWSETKGPCSWACGEKTPPTPKSLLPVGQKVGTPCEISADLRRRASLCSFRKWIRALRTYLSLASSRIHLSRMLRSLAMVVAEHPSEAFPAMNVAFLSTDF